MATKQWLKNNVDKVRKYRRDWYARNKEHEKERIKKRKQEIVEWFKEYKSNLCCKECGEIILLV